MRRMTVILILALTVAFFVPGLAESTYYGTMMVDHCQEWVSLRDGPGTGCGRLAKVPLYDLVTDAEWTPLCGDFIYCNYNGQYGYILSKYLVPWADPEPDPSARFDSALGFSFNYDPDVLTVDAERSEDGAGLILYPEDTDQPIYLELMTGETPDEFVAVNGLTDAECDEEIDDGEALIRRYMRREDEIAHLYYTVEDGENGLVAYATLPSDGAQSWKAQFNAVVFSVTFGASAPIRVDWAETTDALLEVDPDGEYVVITADAPVEDFQMLALDLSEDAYADTAFYSRERLEAGESLVVKIAFPGDIPGYGVRFTDESGTTRLYAIAISGRNGALVLEPF